MFLRTLLVLATGVAVLGQRPGFAGSKPIGYPVLYNITTTTQADGLGNRFGEGDNTTPRLPLEANGDKNLVDRLSKLPIDQQPFWLLNWKALEEQRKNPQTYPQRPSPFNDQPQLVNPNPVAGPTSNKGAVPLTSQFGNRNGGTQSTSSPDPGYHYPDIFSPTNFENSQTADSGASNINGGALSSVSKTTRRPQPPKPPTTQKPIASKPNQHNVPFVGNRNSNDEVKETSSSGTFSATNAFQNGNSVFSNFNSVLKSTNNVDPQGNTVVVQTSGVPAPDAPFQLTSNGVLVPNPAVINTNGAPTISNVDPAMFQYTNNQGLPPNTFITKYTTSSGGPGMNSSVVNSNAGFHNTNTVRKNATHYNSSYQNTYHYSYSFQNKYVVPHGGGAPVKISPQNSNPGFPAQNGGSPNSNVQFVPPAAPNVNVQLAQSNPNNQKRVVQTSALPPVHRVLNNPTKRQGSTDYYFDY